MFTQETQDIIFHLASYTRFVSFSFQTFRLFILKSTEIYYRCINQERRATCFMSLEVSQVAEGKGGGREEQGEDINVNNNSLIT